MSMSTRGLLRAMSTAAVRYFAWVFHGTPNVASGGEVS